MAHVVLCRVSEYDATTLAAGLAAAFEILDIKGLFRSGENILIKPNLLSAVGPEKAVTPHPTVFAALAEQLQSLDLNLSFGDSPAMSQPQSAARSSGLLAVAERLAVRQADFSTATAVRLTRGVHLKEAPIANGVLEADGLVNLCKLKTHALTGMTGAVKNFYGIITGSKKAQLHVQFPDVVSFSQMLVDLNRQFPQRLCVMDAVIAMEGNGPMNGKPRPCGYLIIGQDPVAVDATGAVIMGYDPGDLALLKACHKSGLGTSDPAAIHVTVVDACTGQIEPVRTLAAMAAQLAIPDFLKPELSRSIMTLATKLAGPLIKRHFMQRPVISEALCTRCGQCVKACPVEPKALRQPGSTGQISQPVQPGQLSVPLYRYDRCIRCFCCQEICPAGAISVEPAPLRRIFSGKDTRTRG